MEETDLRPIPKRLLCPKCGRGRLVSADAKKSQIKLGEYKRSAQYTCDRCDYTERRYEDYIGVKDSNPIDPYPHQPNLFE